MLIVKITNGRTDGASYKQSLISGVREIHISDPEPGQHHEAFISFVDPLIEPATFVLTGMVLVMNERGATVDQFDARPKTDEGPPGGAILPREDWQTRQRPRGDIIHVGVVRASDEGPR